MSKSTAVEGLTGRVVRWTFDNGPFAGTIFEHEFRPDGSVVWRIPNGTEDCAQGHVRECGTARIADDVLVASYRGPSGHTLTVILNLERREITAFASDSETWREMTGSFDFVGEAKG